MSAIKALGVGIGGVVGIALLIIVGIVGVASGGASASSGGE